MKKIDYFSSVDQVKRKIATQGYAFGLVEQNDYHSWKSQLENCVSKSSLCEFMKSPYAFRQRELAGERKVTPAMKAGTLADCAALSPWDLPKLYTCEAVDRRTKAGKARAAEIEALGLEVITPDEWERVQVIARHTQETLQYYIGTLYWTQVAMWVRVDNIGGYALPAPLTICGMLDICPFSEELPLIDMKCTSVDIESPTELTRNVTNFKYGLQAALYQDLYKVCTGVHREFQFLFMEAGFPHRARLVNISQCEIDSFAKDYQVALIRYSRCVASGCWGGYLLPEMDYVRPAWDVKKGGEA